MPEHMPLGTSQSLLLNASCHKKYEYIYIYIWFSGGILACLDI